jgi:hypothetical protein
MHQHWPPTRHVWTGVFGKRVTPWYDSDSWRRVWHCPWNVVQRTVLSEHYHLPTWPRLAHASNDPCPRIGPWTFGRHRSGACPNIVNRANSHSSPRPMLDGRPAIDAMIVARQTPNQFATSHRKPVPTDSSDWSEELQFQGCLMD